MNCSKTLSGKYQTGEGSAQAIDSNTVSAASVTLVNTFVERLAKDNGGVICTLGPRLVFYGSGKWKTVRQM